MENAIEAFKMAFAVLVFIGALSLAMYSFTMVRQTSDAITSETDQRQYYQQLRLEETGDSSSDQTSALAASSRIVGLETVIPTLYRYQKEQFTVVFYRAIGYNEETNTFEDLEPLTLYYTETDDANLAKSTLANGRAIFGFDANDENIRQEPWISQGEGSSGSNFFNLITQFVNSDYTQDYPADSRIINIGLNSSSLISGFNEFNSTNQTYRYKFIELGNLINRNPSPKFIERSGEYSSDNIKDNTDDDEDNPDFIDPTLTESYIELDNGEQVTRRNQATKRVIQYILIN